MSIEKRGGNVSKDEAAEGDVNLTPRRKRWEAENLGPLVIEERDLEQALAILDQAIGEAAA